MKILVACLGLTLFAFIILFLRDYYVRVRLQRLGRTKYQALKALIEKLRRAEGITKNEIFDIAQNPSLRIVLFRTLEIHSQQHMFPLEFYTEEKGAESHMVNWLEFPTELGQAPDDILVMRIVTLDLKVQVHYYVFKFRSATPRWAHKLKWMMGVCGPYDAGSKPFDVPVKIFSRFNPVDVTKPEAEVQWVHDNINKHLNVVY